MSKIKSVRQQDAAAAPRFQLNLLTALVGVALTQLALPAWADSGTDGDPRLGNALNPAGVSMAREADPDGMSEQLKRTPTGFLHTYPWAVPERNKTASGWVYRGVAEVGVLGVGGDKDAYKFREYKDLRNGLYLNNFFVEGERPESASYFEALGGALGRNDQYVGLTFGKYNDYRIRAYYNETPHVFTTTYRNLWNGTGTNNVTLISLPAGGVTSAAATDTAIENAALATPYSALSILRQKGGLRLDWPVSDAWKIYAAASSERREGARPFGMVMGGGGGTGGVEIPESIDYDTHDIVAGVQWNGARTSANLQASASLFRNNVSTMTIESPLFVAAANGVAAFPRAVYDLYPDNDSRNIKGEVSHSMSEFWNARVTAVYSATQMRQNDALIPYTPYSGVTINGVAGGQWDTTASLSRASAQQKLDTTLVDLGLALNPAQGLDVKAKWRQYETDNKSTPYFACNPLTGQWGRVINDGSGANVVNTPAYLAAGCNLAAVQALNISPSAGNIFIAPAPYAHKQTNASLGADYRLANTKSVNATIERETLNRDHRERAETREDKLKVGYVDRSFAGGTLRVSAEQDRRRGDRYNSDPYDEFYSASLGPVPTAVGTNITSWIHVNDLHRKFDLADRDQTILNARFNMALREDLDLSLSAQSKSIKYPDSQFGRNGRHRINTLNADVNWQPTPATSFYGYASAQRGSMTQRNVQQNACVIGNTYFFFSDGSVNTTGTPADPAATVVGSNTVTADNFATLCGAASPTSPLYPTSRAFTVTQKETTPTLGVGFKHDFGKALLDLSYEYTESKTKVSYTYNPAALGLTATVVGLAGTGFSDIVFKQQVINANVLIPVNKSVSVRLLGRYEMGKFRDWHYEGVAANPSPAANQQTYLDSGPQDYDAYAIGAFLQVKW